jgi:FemAB-related protein (PEP-CTERM system-associated)
VLPLVHLNSRLFGSFLISLPCFNYCGAIAENDEALAALIDYAHDLTEQVGASHVELRHRGDMPLDLPARYEKVGMALSLPGLETELWQSFSSKLRSQIRRPTKEGASCQHGGRELLDPFYDVFSRNMRDLGTPVYPRSLFAEMCAQFSDYSQIFIVDMGGSPVAAGLTISYRNRIEVPFASSLRSYNRYSPNMLLYWSMLQHGVRQGYSIFDFGRCTVDSGSYRFKKQWGAVPELLAWHYILSSSGELPRINPDNPKFRFAINLWRRLPMRVANFLGPQVVKHLP